jgi:enoyl-CoA hydratase
MARGDGNATPFGRGRQRHDPRATIAAHPAAGGTLSDERLVLLELEERLAVLTVNRPQVRNALDTATVAAFHAALEQVRAARCGALIITGAGEQAFVSGADISAIRERRRDEALAGINSRLMSAVEAHEAVSIAAVNGWALGGGCELALACDLRIASETAVFGLPEPTLGIIPGAGGTQRLPRIVGLGRAKEMVLTGARWDARQALAAGLVSEVVPRERLMDAARALAARALALGPLALRLAKAALNASAQAPLGAGLSYESALQALTFESEDKMEGTTAFLEKRRPRFTGR